MKAVLALFHGLFDGLFTIPLFDTGVSFGQFIMALMLLDITFIVVCYVLRKDSSNSGSSSNGGSDNGGIIKK